MTPVLLEYEDTQMVTPWGPVSDAGPVVLISVWLVAQMLDQWQRFCTAGTALLGRGMARVTDDGRMFLLLEDGSAVFDLYPALTTASDGHAYIAVRREKLDEPTKRKGGER